MSVQQCSSTRRRRRVLSHPKATSPARHARYRSTTRRRRRNTRPQSRWDVMLPSLSPHKAASTTRALGPGLVVLPSTSSATRRLLRRSASAPPAASVVLHNATHPKTGFARRLLPTKRFGSKASRQPESRRSSSGTNSHELAWVPVLLSDPKVKRGRWLPPPLSGFGQCRLLRITRKRYSSIDARHAQPPDQPTEVSRSRGVARLDVRVESTRWVHHGLPRPGQSTITIGRNR